MKALCNIFHHTQLSMLDPSVCVSPLVLSVSLDSLDCSLLVTLSMNSSRYRYWRGLPFLSPEIFPHPGSNLGFLHLWADSFIV